MDAVRLVLDEWFHQILKSNGDQCAQIGGDRAKGNSPDKYYGYCCFINICWILFFVGYSAKMTDGIKMLIDLQYLHAILLIFETFNFGINPKNDANER